MKPQLLQPERRIWRRDLSVAGEIAVSPGDRVQPDTLLAQAQMPAPPVVVELGQAQPLVLKGQEVQAGEVVAKRKKLIGGGEEIQAPIAGKVLLVEPGALLLQPPPLSVTIEAQLPGIIATVRAGWGADVEGCFGLLRGWGSRGSSLHGVLGEDIAVATEPLTTSSLQALASQGLRAIIASSWGEDAPFAEAAIDAPALFFTEPLRGRPMATPIAEALQRHKGQPAALQLDAQPRLAFASESSDREQCFGPGAWVRTADGRAARILRLDESPRFFASGLRGVPADVDLGDTTATLPVDSLEWIA